MSRMRYGVSKVLEDEADRFIQEKLSAMKSHTAKRDILTASKEKNRRKREVYLPSVDASVRKGMFNKVISPHSHLNSIDVPYAVPTHRTKHPRYEEDD